MHCIAKSQMFNFVATWIALHNGGGTGWGEATNGGFGLVLDGSDQAAKRAAQMLKWDVNNGVSNRYPHTY
jgi:urocanate hydratase